MMRTLVLLLIVSGTAAAESWRTVPEDSSLTFEAIQQNAPFTGRFGKFTATIELDPAELMVTDIDARITLTSVDTGNDDRDDALRDTPWFDVASWPEATFVATDIVDNQAQGILTLRDVSQSVALPVSLEQESDGRIRLTGSTQVNRLDFNLGTGEWADTTWVGAEVTIRVDVVLTPAN